MNRRRFLAGLLSTSYMIAIPSALVEGGKRYRLEQLLSKKLSALTAELPRRFSDLLYADGSPTIRGWSSL